MLKDNSSLDEENFSYGNNFLKQKFEFFTNVDSYYILSSIKILHDVFSQIEIYKPALERLIEEEKESSGDL